MQNCYSSQRYVVFKFSANSKFIRINFARSKMQFNKFFLCLPKASLGNRNIVHGIHSRTPLNKIIVNKGAELSP